MPGKKSDNTTSKKAQGQARKAEAAANKQAAKDRENEAQEAAEWSKGAKNNSKADAAAAKQAEAARKKAEKDALLAAEEASLPSKGSSKSKVAEKKTRGLDLGQLDTPSTALNASGIDNALDALSLISDGKQQIERHPERRFPAAYKAYEEKRLEELKADKGLRRQQKIEMIRKEFDKHPDNPFNQVNANYNATKDSIAEIRAAEKDKVEQRLGAKS